MTAPRQSAREVFTGPAFQQLRREMLVERLPACHACDMYTPENTLLHDALADAAAAGARAPRSMTGAPRRLPVVPTP